MVYWETKYKNIITGKIESDVSIGKNPSFKKGKSFSKGMGIFKQDYKYVSHKIVKSDVGGKLLKSWGWKK